MEAARDITTRSHSSLGDYVQMNQRKPNVGEFVRARIIPDKRKYDNVHTHGWVTIRVEECHEKKPKDKDDHGQDYVVKGSMHKTSKSILILLMWRGDDDALDYRYRQGWDIVEEGTKPDEEEKHIKRLINSQHIDNMTQTQVILTEEEFQEYRTNTQQDYVNMATDNEYVEPRRILAQLSTPKSTREEDTIPTSVPKLRKKPCNNDLRPSAPPSFSTSETTHMSDATRSDTDTTDSSSWEVTDYEYTKMLGKKLEDNLLSITRGYQNESISNINALPDALASERLLIKQTNMIHNYLKLFDWVQNPEDVKRYIRLRKKWFAIASRYRNDRDRVLYLVEQHIEPYLSLPGLSIKMKDLMRELDENSDDNKFMDMLKQADQRMMTIDEAVNQLNSEEFQSMGSIFEFDDFTVGMNDDALAKFSDDETLTLKLKTSVAKDNKQRGKEVSNLIVEHPALRNLGEFDPRRGTNLTVNMSHVEATPPATEFKVRTDQVPDPGVALPPTLENLLHDDITDLVQNARTIYANIISSTDDISDTSPNKHTEETLRDFEKKVDKVDEKKTELNETYKSYIVKYTQTPNMNVIWNLSKEVTTLLRSMREGVELFRARAAPKIGYEEITYARLKDTKAPYLNITEFKGETSLPLYLEWIHEHKRLPSNLLNSKLTATLPSIVNSRLCQQHPEGSRTVDDVIKFLLKTYGRTSKLEEQLRVYHNNIGTLNSLFNGGSDESVNPHSCKEIVTNADKHLVGLRSIILLKKICNTYLDRGETELWFQESLHTHGFCTWLALNILTMNQVLRFTEKSTSTGEQKIEWIIEQIEELRDKADRIISSGMVESMQNLSVTRPVLMTNQVSLNTPSEGVQIPEEKNNTLPNTTWQVPQINQPNIRPTIPQATPTTAWRPQNNNQIGHGIPPPLPLNNTWKTPLGIRPTRQPTGANWNNIPTTTPQARPNTLSQANVRHNANNTQPIDGRPLNEDKVRSTNYPGQYNEWLSTIFKDAIIHNCDQRTNCASSESIAYTESWFYSRQWFILDNIRINNGQNYSSLFDNPKFNNVCGAQRRRIAYLLGSPNSCTICTQHLATSTDLLPLPHYMFSNHSTEHDFAKNRCRVIKWPLGCPQVLKEGDPISKLKDLIRKGVIPGCPAACNVQYQNNYNPESRPLEKCRMNKCQGFNPITTIRKLQGELQDIIRTNNVDFTNSSGRVLILAAIYSAIKRKSEITKPDSLMDKQLLYGTQGELFHAFNVQPIKSRTSRFAFIHYNIQSQSGDQSLLKVFQDTCCSSTAIRHAVAGKDIAGSNAGNVTLEVTGSMKTQEQTLDFLLNQQKGHENTLRMNNAIIMDSLIQTQNILDTSCKVGTLLNEMRSVCEEHGVPYDIDEENVPVEYGGQLDLLIGNSVFELERLFTSSFGLSLYNVPLTINGKRSYAIGGYLDKEAGFETEPELFIRKIGRTSTKHLVGTSRGFNQKPTFVGLSRFNNPQGGKNSPMEQESFAQKTPAAMRLHRPFRTIHEVEEPNTDHENYIKRGAQTILFMSSTESKATTTPNDLNDQDQLSIHELRLPKMDENFSLKQYLQHLQLAQVTDPIIDKTGSCGYDSIWYSMKNEINNLTPQVKELLNPTTRFPIRDLCKKLLRLPPNGKPWNSIHNIFQQEVRDQLVQTESGVSDHAIEAKVKIRWESQADGDTWIDTYILRLIALAMNYNMVIFQNQPDKMKRFNITTISGGDTSNTNKPILLLLSHSHYTPLNDDSNMEAWYELCAKGKLAPWIHENTDIPYQNPNNGLYDQIKQESTSATSNGECMFVQPHQQEHNRITDTEDHDDQRNKKENNNGWIKVKRRKKPNTKLTLSKNQCEPSRPTTRKYWNITNDDDTTSATDDSDMSDASDITTGTNQQVHTPRRTTTSPKKMKRCTNGETLKNNSHHQDTILFTKGSSYSEITPSDEDKGETQQRVIGGLYQEIMLEQAKYDDSKMIQTYEPVSETSTIQHQSSEITMNFLPNHESSSQIGELEGPQINVTIVNDTQKPISELTLQARLFDERYAKYDDSEKTTTYEPVSQTTTIQSQSNKIPMNCLTNHKSSRQIEELEGSPNIVTTINDTQKPISDMALQARLFDERYDMKTRCESCQQCKRCSPFITIPVKERENMEKNEENIQIRKFMRIMETDDNRKKFVTKMPCEQEVMDAALRGTNRKEVVAANDKKLKQLTTDQQKELWEEFSKLVEMGYIKNVNLLPEEIKDKLDKSNATYYIAVAPAFKSTSTSTKTRCAFDASMQNRTTKKSLNDCLPIGYMGISLTSTFRNFRTHPIGIACDLKKYYNSIEVHEDSFPVNRIVFRDNADPSGELKEYVLQNLFYGIRPAGSITDEALKFIAREAVLKCEPCGLNNSQDIINDTTMQEINELTNVSTDDEGYSEDGVPIIVQFINEDKLNPTCKTVHHEVYKLLQRKYVDDILHSTYTYDRVNEIKEFTEKELNSYSFATKGWNVTGDTRTPGQNNLNNDNKLGTCSYLWDPYTDKFKPKEVLLHNGERFRGAIKPMKNWIRTTEFGQYFTVEAPKLKTKMFKDVNEITVEALEDLWRGTPRTLRSGLSKTYMLFEPCGFLAPIAGQTRAALHEIVKLNGNSMEKEVQEPQWKHLLKCMVEQLKAMTYEYERRPDRNDIDETCKNLLFTFVDYGANICVVSYLVTITKKGKPSVIILHAKTLNRKRTVPQGELDAFKEGSIQHKMLLTELIDVISEDYMFSDSTICIYQLLSEKQHDNVFVDNRVRDIKNNIDVLNKVFHVKSEENLADTGTRYGTSTNDTNFLTCESVAPHSTFANGRYWFQDLNKAENSGIITSAKTLKEKTKSAKQDTDREERCLMTQINVTCSPTNLENIPHLICSDSEEEYDEDVDDSNNNVNRAIEENMWEEYYTNSKIYITEPPCRCTCECTDQCNVECKGCFTSNNRNNGNDNKSKKTPGPEEDNQQDQSLQSTVIDDKHNITDKDDEKEENTLDEKRTIDSLAKPRPAPKEVNWNEELPIMNEERKKFPDDPNFIMWRDLYRNMDPFPNTSESCKDERDSLKETNTNLSETRTAITPTTDQEQELKTTNVEEDAKHMKKETQKPQKYYKCGMDGCTTTFSFRRNLITHCNMDHENIDEIQLTQWLINGDKFTTQATDTTQTNHQSCLLSITQIHNKRNNTTISQDVLDQVQTRYWYPGHTNLIQGIQYVNDLKKETFRTFTKNFKVTRTVVKASMAFLKLIKKRLKLIDQYHEHFKYLTTDPEENHLAYGKLSSRVIAKHNHSLNVTLCTNLQGTEDQRITNIKTRSQSMITRNDLVCLRGSYSGQELLDERNSMWSLPYTRCTIRLLSQLFNLARRTVTQENCDDYPHIWNIIFKLLMTHTNYMKSKTFLANCVIHDVTEILVFLIKRDRGQYLATSLKKIMLPDELHWLQGMENFFLHNIIELPKRSIITKLMIFDSEDYHNATKATAALYGIKINSETKEFAKERDLKIFAIQKDDHWLANKRTSNFGDDTPDPEIEQLLQDDGVGLASLFHEVFSPVTWSIMTFLHLPHPSLKMLQRRTFSHIPQHLGRPKLLALAQRRYYISKASRVCDLIISLCPQCRLRNKKTEPSPHGRIPLFLMKNNPRPYSCTHIDLAGPLKLLVNPGNMTTRNQQQVSVFTLVAVCSLTKHTTMLLLNGTGTGSVSLALSALMRRVGQPSLIIADSQSSFTKIMRENSIVTQNDDIMEINSIPIKLIPVGNIGHTHAGSVEKKIDLLRRLIGQFDFTKTSLAISDFQNILDVAAGSINKTPIGIRRADKAIQDITSSPLVKYISPETLYNPRYSPSPESFISITKDINNYMQTNDKLSKFVSDLMHNYLMELQNQGIDSYEDYTLLQEGDIVSFKTKDFQHHNYHHEYTTGMIHSIYPDPIDKIVRTVKVSYLARPGERVFMDDTMVTLTKGLYCTTTRPVKSLIKICGKNDVEETFKQDAERTESWLKSHFSKHGQNQQEALTGPSNDSETTVIIDHTINAKDEDDWRPDQLLCSKLQSTCAGRIQELQERLIRGDISKEQFMVPPDKLHITHLVLKGTELSEKMFYEANKEIQQLQQQIKYTLGSLNSYNGNIVVELKSTQLLLMQKIFKNTCDQYDISYDKKQTYHITLFKKKYKKRTGPKLSSEEMKLHDSLTTSHYSEVTHEIKEIDLCHMDKTPVYFPIISSYTHGQGKDDEMKTRINQTEERIDPHPQPKTLLKVRVPEMLEEVQDICEIESSTNSLVSQQGVKVISKPNTELVVRMPEPRENIKDIDKRKRNEEVIRSGGKNWEVTAPVQAEKGVKHNYNTRQMDQFKVALMTLIFLTMNTVTGNPNINRVNLAEGNLTENQYGVIRGQQITHQEVCCYSKPIQSTYAILPVITVLMIALILLLEIIYALSGKSKEQARTSDLKSKRSIDGMMPMKPKKQYLGMKSIESTCKDKRAINESGKFKSKREPKWKGPMTIICLLIVIGPVSANLEDNISNLHESIDKLMAAQQKSGSNIKNIYDNFMKMQPKIELEKKWDLKQLIWLPDKLNNIATIIHQATVMETNARSHMKRIIQEAAINNIHIIKGGVKLLSKRIKRETTSKSKSNNDKLHMETTVQPRGRLIRRSSNIHRSFKRAKGPDYIKKINDLFDDFNNSDRPSEENQRFFSNVQSQFDGNLEELRPIKILMGRSDTTDIRAMKDAWMAKASALPKTNMRGTKIGNGQIYKVIRTTNTDSLQNQEDTRPLMPQRTTIETSTTQASTTLPNNTTNAQISDLGNVIQLMNELEMFNEMFALEEGNIKTDQLCDEETPVYVHTSKAAPGLCAIYSGWADALAEQNANATGQVKRMGCYIEKTITNIQEGAHEDRILIRNTTETIIHHNLQDIAQYKEQIMEIIERTKLAATFIDDGMNIMTMEIAERQRVMEVLLHKTGQIIHDTMRTEINRLSRKDRIRRSTQLGDKRSRRSNIESILPSGHTVNTINMVDKMGLLPEDVSVGLKVLNTAKSSIDDLNKIGKTVHQRLSDEALEREGDEFSQNIMERIGSQYRNDNKKTITVDEGDEVDIPCFPDEINADTSKMVWLKSDGSLLHNFATELRSDKLHIAVTECNHKGEYKCGIKEGDIWDSYNLDMIWNIYELNVICNTEKRMSIAPNTVIGVEGNTITLQCAAPVDSTVQWTKASGINKDQFSKQGLSIQIPAVTTDDAGIYTCTHSEKNKTTEEQIILQIHKLSVDRYK